MSIYSKTAFANLIENGCKFSENKQCINIAYNDKYTLLDFSDNGVRNYQRTEIYLHRLQGKNKGLLMAMELVFFLTKIILVQNISAVSKETKGTTFTVELLTFKHNSNKILIFSIPALIMF